MLRNFYLAWSITKAIFAVAISPVILLAFFVNIKAFLWLMAALWPHLDIYTPEGELYLRRWFMTPKGRSYPPRFLHLILISDEGRDPHDHPGPFTSKILWNGYNEEIYYAGPNARPDGQGRPGHPFMRYARAGDVLRNPEGHTHAVHLKGPTLSWVVAWKRGKPWGFWVMDPTDPSKDRWVESSEYGEKGVERKSWTIDGK